MATDHGFKLLAIRPLSLMHKSLKRVLQPAVFYKLYSNVEFALEGKNKYPNVKSVNYRSTNTEQLFYTNKGMPLNISAIVGKNGSGKSSIMELLYVAIYNIAYILELMPEQLANNRKRTRETNINVEFYYRIGKTNYKIILKADKITLETQADDEHEFRSKKFDKSDLASFFYSIVINYSHYSLNSKHLGPWVENIFHKNDGYQTPIVLNPFRDKGEIEINNEEDLTYSRLLSILLSSSSSSSELVKGKIADQLKITINDDKLKLKDVNRLIVKELDDNRGEILKTIFRHFPLIRKSTKLNEDDELLKSAGIYLVYKFYKISQRYKPFKNNDEYQFIRKHLSPPPLVPTHKLKKSSSDEWVEHKKEGYVVDFISLEHFCNKLAERSSHYTFKVHQTINFINNIKIYRSRIDKFFPIIDLAKSLNRKVSKTNPLINLIPPSFFKVEIKLKDGGVFSGLSSGEKQQVYSSASYMYHLINLNSVIEENEIIRYSNVNLVFDEVELYYHPELQRSFISDFIANIDKLSLKNIKGINCIFITHSPFILSDIPNANVLFLEGKAEPMKHEKALDIKTFGANIHDLLKNSFFLENGSMGEFAKKKITETIDFMNLEIHKTRRPKANDSNDKPKNTELKEWKDEKERLKRKVGTNTNHEYHEGVIKMIGEPILRKKLLSMYREITSESELDKINREIEHLEKKREQLKLEKDA